MVRGRREISSHARCVTPPLMETATAGPQLVGNERGTMAQNRKWKGILGPLEISRAAGGSSRR